MGGLEREFFNRGVVEVAEDLLGKSLCRQIASGEIKRKIITEVEAYDGPEDLACHGRFGMTKRTEVMFKEGGHWYVYLCYGIHWMLNIVTGIEGYPAAVLIRGVDTELLNGPGKLTKYFEIDKKFNGLICDVQSQLWIESAKNSMSFQIERTQRIGIDYAGPVWSKKLYRFVLKKK